MQTLGATNRSSSPTIRRAATSASSPSTTPPSARRSAAPASGRTQSTEEALQDVLRLSRGMTYKSAVAGLNLGGGKAVIIADPKRPDRESLFRAHGRFVETLGGRYITAEDVGTSPTDMEFVRRETQARGRPAQSLRRSVAGHRLRRVRRHEGLRQAALGQGLAGRQDGRGAGRGQGRLLPDEAPQGRRRQAHRHRHRPGEGQARRRGTRRHRRSPPTRSTTPRPTSSRPARSAPSSTTTRSSGSRSRSSPAAPTTSSPSRGTASSSRSRGSSTRPTT